MSHIELDTLRIPLDERAAVRCTDARQAQLEQARRWIKG
jgi:hypothetical protein